MTYTRRITVPTNTTLQDIEIASKDLESFMNYAGGMTLGTVERPIVMETQTSSKMLEDFGISDINTAIEEVKKFLDAVSSKDVKSKKYEARSTLAASFPSLDKKSVKIMDDYLKSTITLSVNSLRELSLEDATWENVKKVFSQNAALEPIYGSEKNRTDSLIKNRGTSWFKFDGSPDPIIVAEVKEWFKKLVNDPYVMKATKIAEDPKTAEDPNNNIDFLSKLVAASGALVESFETFFYKKELKHKTVMDLGVIRFPDLDNPFITVYRIKLEAWNDCTRTLFVQEDKSGIAGEFNVIKYKPRKSVLDRVQKRVLCEAAREAERLLGVPEKELTKCEDPKTS